MCTRTYTVCVCVCVCLCVLEDVMARRRRRRRPGGHTTAVGSGGRRAPISTDTASHTHTARSRLPPTHPFVGAPILQRHFQVRWRARLPHPRVLLPHTCTLDGWFLQPKRRPARYTQPRSLENRTRLSNGFRGLGFGVGKIIPGYRFW